MGLHCVDNIPIGRELILLAQNLVWTQCTFDITIPDQTIRAP